MGIHESAKEVLASPSYFDLDFVWGIDGDDQRFSDCTIYLYDFLASWRGGYQKCNIGIICLLP